MRKVRVWEQPVIHFGTSALQSLVFVHVTRKHNISGTFNDYFTVIPCCESIYQQHFVATAPTVFENASCCAKSREASPAARRNTKRPTCFRTFRKLAHEIQASLGVQH